MPQSDDKKSVSVKLPKDVWRAVKMQALNRDTTVSEIVADALRTFVNAEDTA